MQNKLVTVSLAAMAHQALAVQTENDQVFASPGDALLSYYQNCNVVISDLTGSMKTIGNSLRLSSTFDLSGVDENCPELTATLWLEPPAECVANGHCQLEGLEYVMDNEDVINGSISHTFTTSQVSGDWTAHVTVSPYGFECGMSIAEACATVDIDIPCAAKVTDFSGYSAINQEKGMPPAYWGEDGMVHTMNWSVSDLWNCNLCANYYVQDKVGESKAEGNMQWEVLYEFSEHEEISVSLFSDSSWNDFDYTLTLVECGSESDTGAPVLHVSPPFHNETIEVTNPFPDCTVEGELLIDSVFVEYGAINIAQTLDQYFSYTCVEADLTSTLKNDDYYTFGMETTDGTQTHTSNPFFYEALIWDNFPILVNSTVTAMQNSTVLGTFEDQYSFWPDCEYSVETPSISALIVNGTDITNHKLTIDTVNTGTINNYCPDFVSTVQLYRNGEKFISKPVEASQTATLAYSSDIDTSFLVDFNDGTWCAEFIMTPSATKPGVAAVTKTSAQSCVDVVAYECELSPSTFYNGNVNVQTQVNTFTTDASFQMSAWCAAEDLTFSWTFKYMDLDWMDANEYNDYVIDYHTSLAVNQTVGYTWLEAVSDYQLDTLFVVSYTSTTFTSQMSVAADATATYQYAQICRPKFAFDPIIMDLSLDDDGTLIFQLDLQFNTSGIQKCGEMHALIEIFDANTDTLVYNTTMDDAEVSQYQQVDNQIKTFTGIDEQTGCYIIKITYGQVDVISSQVTATTDATCWTTVCTLSNANITLIDQTASADGSSYIWTFDTSVVPNKWCSIVNQHTCLYNQMGQKLTCGEPDVPAATATNFVITQTKSFAGFNFTYEVTFTSDDGSHDSSTDWHKVAFTPINTPGAPCQYTHVSDVSILTDTLNNVSVYQSENVTATPICGSQNYTYISNIAGNSSDTLLTTHTWDIASETKQYCFQTLVTFEYDGASSLTEKTCVDWIQGCEVQVTTVAFTSFVAADNTTSTEAQANINIAGVALGDCGAVDVAATMTGSDGSSYTFAVSDAFFTAAGQNINQEISRTKDNYTVVVDMTAPNAQSVLDHQGMTANVGFVNILSDSASTTGVNMLPVCDVVAESITWISYAEVTDYSGPMVATYSGVVTAELSCVALTASLRIKPDQTQAYYNETEVTLIPSGDGYTYTWTQTIYGENIYHSPVGLINVWDSSNAADYSAVYTDEILWAPPCYLVVNYFNKLGQETSLDQARTTLDYSLSLAHFGDQACTQLTAEVTLQTADQEYFNMILDNSDLEVALSPSGFNVSIQTESSKADSAKVIWTDVRAVQNQTATAAGFDTPADYSCAVQVRDFCLNDAAELSDGRWAFNFTIRVEQNSQCGTLTASMDLVNEDNYFANVAIDGNAIIDAFNCNCEKTFTVTADYEGALGEVYGQIDIRNGQQQIVQMMDSSSFEI